MGWTERTEVKTDYEDIITYLEEKDCFHDYRIGNVYYKGINAEITIEEVVPGVRIQDSTGLIWQFRFEGISSFEFSADCVVGLWITEVERGEKDNEILFSLVQGYISVVAENIALGIPSPEQKHD